MDLDEYVGLLFAERGRDRAGIDCWGLLALVYAERFGIELPSHRDDYQNTADAEAVASLVEGGMGIWREIEAGQERAGDGVMMRGEPMHVGIVQRPGWCLHIERGAGSVIEDYHSARLRRRVLGFYRHEQMEQV